jgi:uncharacterized protein (TIGR00730 family)
MSQNKSKIIAVFGGSRPPENSREYAEAYTVGKLLAQKGFVVMNGGYAGTMEASARGAQEHGGHSIGVLSGEFAHLKANPYIVETQISPDLFSRIREMQTRADGFIVLKGSMGTLAELALVWNLAKIDAKHRKPIVLLGEHWAQVLRVWRSELAVTEEEAALLQCADKPEEAVELMVKQLP